MGDLSPTHGKPLARAIHLAIGGAISLSIVLTAQAMLTQE